MDDPDENAGDEPPPGNVKKKNLTGGQVKQIVSQLLLLVKEGDENHSLKYLNHPCMKLFYCKDAFRVLFFKWVRMPSYCVEIILDPTGENLKVSLEWPSDIKH